MKNIFIVIFIIIAGTTAWYFLSPLFISKEVNEDLPGVENFNMPTSEDFARMSPEELDRIKKPTMDAAALMPDKMIEEKMPATAEEISSKTTPPPVPAQKSTPAPTPELISKGAFSSADSFHRAEGSAAIYKLPDGSRILRLENFNVTNGPDLRVLLSKGGNPDVSLELGELKGNRGNQNYDIPQNTDVSSYDSIVIYCKPFHVVFGTAFLQQ